MVKDLFLAFSLSGIPAFLSGLLAGVVLTIVVATIIITSKSKAASIKSSSTVEGIDKDQIKQMVKEHQKGFIKLVEEDEQDYMKAFSKEALELLSEVAKHYFPDSENPIYELTVDEIKESVIYIINSLYSLLDKPGIRKIKKVRISRIKFLISKTKKKDKKKSELLDEGKAAVGAVSMAANPVSLFKNVIIKGSVNILIKKCLNEALSLIGKESDKIYSKELFNKESEDLSDIEYIEEK